MSVNPGAFPGNSHVDRVAKQDAQTSSSRKKLDSVPVKVTPRKKNFWHRTLEAFTGDDIQSVGSYLWEEVMIPATKNLISDIVSEGAERLIWGDDRPTHGRRGFASSVAKFSYNKVQPQMQRTVPSSRRERTNFQFQDYLFESRADAEQVLDTLFSLFDTYQQATVADLYDLMDITPSYTDQKWGWTSPQYMKPVRVNGGYVLDLPRPQPLD